LVLWVAQLVECLVGDVVYGDVDGRGWVDCFELFYAADYFKGR
jgi:hypothetical protein